MARKESTLRDLGEDELVRRLTNGLPLGKRTLVGPGDDCAVLATDDSKRRQLFKTDCIIERVHFLPDAAPAKVGWKALCRCISDIGSMGGWPTEAVVTIAAPADASWQRLKGIYAGLRKAAETYDVGLVGGETSSVPVGAPMFISVAMLGLVETERLVTRSGGTEGDLVFVTGKLGGSILGWHLNFTPRLEQARWLAQHAKPTAMMDLSDGIARDLPRLAEASGVGFELFPEALPKRRGCSMEQALNDGEDYELLFSVKEKTAANLEKKWKVKFPSLALTQVGRLGDEDYGEIMEDGITLDDSSGLFFPLEVEEPLASDEVRLCERESPDSKTRRQNLHYFPAEPVERRRLPNENTANPASRLLMAAGSVTGVSAATNVRS